MATNIIIGGGSPRKSGGGAGLSTQIVSELPSIGSSGVIYLIPAISQTENNKYDEYIFVNGSFELLGSSINIPEDCLELFEANSKRLDTLEADADTIGSVKYYIEQSYVWNDVN